MNAPKQLLALMVGAAIAGCNGAPDRPDGAEEESPAPSLLEIMRQLEVDTERVAHGIWMADYDSIAVVAQAIADHPQVGPEERAEILGILGEGAAGFRQADVYVHDTALEVVDAAGGSAMPAVLAGFNRLQEGCVACHTGYRSTIQAARQ